MVLGDTGRASYFWDIGDRDNVDKGGFFGSGAVNHRVLYKKDIWEGHPGRMSLEGLDRIKYWQTLSAYFGRNFKFKNWNYSQILSVLFKIL